MTSPLAAEEAIKITASLISLARIETDTSVWPKPLVQVPRTEKVPTICFDEWNMWDEERAPGNQGAEEKYNVSDALAIAVWLNVFVRQSQHLGMCNLAQSVNVISPLITTETGIIKQTTYWPLFLFSKYIHGQTLAVNLRCPEWKGERTKPEWIRSTVKTPWLDVSATIDDEGWVNLAVVNISESESFETSLVGVPQQVDVFTVGADAENAQECNMTGGKVSIVESSWDGVGPYSFLRHSFTLLRWKSIGAP